MLLGVVLVYPCLGGLFGAVPAALTAVSTEGVVQVLGYDVGAHAVMPALARYGRLQARYAFRVSAVRATAAGSTVRSR